MEYQKLRKAALAIFALVLGLVLGALVVGTTRIASWLGAGPDPETIAAASLQSVREQAKLVPFAARFVSVVTSSQRRFGFSAEKTLIMPGMVRYEVDLARLEQDDLDWDEDSDTLTVELPPLAIAGPEIDLTEIKEYSEGGILMALTDAEGALDDANRRAAREELLEQARAPLPMKLARNAAKSAIERSFAMPLKAAGFDARVIVRFENEARTLSTNPA
ncbi:MAG: DUF4230 domain-containing protein [Sphingomonadaceae bacterium]